VRIEDEEDIEIIEEERECVFILESERVMEMRMNI